MNPVLTKATLENVQQWAQSHGAGAVPHFLHDRDTITVPAAWLIEQAGWHKGFRRSGVGISDNHPLALVNYGGTTKALLELARDIETSVKEQFTITLTREPAVLL